MSSPRPYEELLLGPTGIALERECHRLSTREHIVRLEILEAVASLLGGFSLAGYRSLIPTDYEVSEAAALRAAEAVLSVLQAANVHPSLGLCALSRSPKESGDRRNGVYYTDFRLARYVAESVVDSVGPDVKVIDPACGTGTLLVALSIAAGKSGRVSITDFLEKSVCGADLSEAALRGAVLSLASLTDQLAVVRRLSERLRRQDSLAEGCAGWRDLAPVGFDIVVGNPPWEKLKVIRHEFLKRNGVDRHYGAEYSDADDGDPRLAEERALASTYAKALRGSYQSQGSGEPDLYRAFLELSCRLTRQGGRVGILVPAGLIRSSGTLPLRRLLLQDTSSLKFTVFHNRTRFFAIDTRFKFLCVEATMEPNKRGDDLFISHASGTSDGVRAETGVRIARDELAAIRPDLTVPEVRSGSEWLLFRKMAQNGVRMDDPCSPFAPKIVRELDMSNDHVHFKRAPSAGALPIVEGRMVHQFHFGAKSFVSGTGRKAIWRPNPFGCGSIAPQFWFPSSRLGPEVATRTRQRRIGFCDVTGQTNERSMMAALVPPGVVCGNKVPTILFPNDPSEERLLLWLGIANSMPFDWALRRVVTTTVNYFLLRGVALPRVGLQRQQVIVSAVEGVHEMAHGKCEYDGWMMAKMRVTIDLEVLDAYGLDFDDLSLLLKDFPLLDRGQPPIPGEELSTVTRDYLLTQAAERYGCCHKEGLERLGESRARGALPYVPSEFCVATALAEGPGSEQHSDS